MSIRPLRLSGPGIRITDHHNDTLTILSDTDPFYAITTDGGVYLTPADRRALAAFLLEGLEP